MVTSLLIGLRHDSEDISILKDLFHKLDTNNDGTISKEELETAADELHDMNFFAFKDLNWDEIFQKMDLDGNGKVDFHEFCVASVDHKKLLSEKNLKYVFATLDQDQSGTIELSELKGSLPSSFKSGQNNIEKSRESAYRKAKANLADQPKQGEKRPFFKDTAIE